MAVGDKVRRAIARGRIVPQSLSTDPRYGRLCLKGKVLYPLLWVNSDDQGRLSGDPDEIKYAVCPNVREISPEDIPSLLEQIETQGMICVYTTSKTKAIQMLDWWEEQRLQWAWPSRYPPPEGWKDRLRFKKGSKEVITENWVSPEASPEVSPEGSPEVSPENSPENSPERLKERERTKEKESKRENEVKRGNRRGRGRSGENSPENSPEPSGEVPSPSLTVDTDRILKELTQCFKIGWGKLPSILEPNKVIPREPNARESAQLRDLAKNLSAVGGVPLDFIKQAFGEGAVHNKMFISYVRKILLAWLDRETP